MSDDCLTPLGTDNLAPINAYKRKDYLQHPVGRLQLFGSLCATVFLVNLARIVYAPLLQPVAADFGVTAASLGVIATAAWLGSALPRMPTGYILTFVPRHYVVIATGTLLVFTSAFTGLAMSVEHLLVGAFFMGLSSGMYFIAANPLLSELFPQRIGRILGIHGMSSQIAAVSAPLIVGGILLFTDNWRMTFFIISATAAITTSFIVYASRRVDLPHAGSEDRSLLVAARAQWPLILTGIIIAGTIGFLWNGLFNLYGDYLEVVKGIDEDTGRLLLSGMFAAGIPAWLISGQMADRWPNIPVLAFILFLFSGAVIGLTVVDGFLAVAALSLIAGYGFFAMIPVLDTYLLASLPDRHRGSAYTWYSATMMIFTALGSGVIGTAVSSGVPYDVAFQVPAVAVAITGIGLFLAYRLGVLQAVSTRR